METGHNLPDSLNIGLANHPLDSLENPICQIDTACLEGEGLLNDVRDRIVVWHNDHCTLQKCCPLAPGKAAYSLAHSARSSHPDTNIALSNLSPNAMDDDYISLPARIPLNSIRKLIAPSPSPLLHLIWPMIPPTQNRERGSSVDSAGTLEIRDVTPGSCRGSGAKVLQVCRVGETETTIVSSRSLEGAQ